MVAGAGGTSAGPVSSRPSCRTPRSLTSRTMSPRRSLYIIALVVVFSSLGGARDSGTESDHFEGFLEEMGGALESRWELLKNIRYYTVYNKRRLTKMVQQLNTLTHAAAHTDVTHHHTDAAHHTDGYRLTDGYHHTDATRRTDVTHHHTDVKHHTDATHRTDATRHTDVKHHTNAKHHTDGERLTDATHHTDVKHHTDGERLTDVTHHPDVTRHHDVTHHTDGERHTDVTRRTGVTPHTDVTRHPDVTRHTDGERYTDVTPHADVTRQNDVTRHTDVKGEAKNDVSRQDWTHAVDQVGSAHTGRQLETQAGVWSFLEGLSDLWFLLPPAGGADEKVSSTPLPHTTQDVPAHPRVTERVSTSSHNTGGGDGPSGPVGGNPEAPPAWPGATQFGPPTEASARVGPTYQSLLHVADAMHDLYQSLGSTIDASTTTTTTADAGREKYLPCNAPFQEIAYRMCILQETRRKLDWSQARSFCWSHGADLAQEAVVIKARRYLDDQYGEEGTRVRWPMWVGGKQKEEGSSGWQWVGDGSSVPAFLWSQNQPRQYPRRRAPEGLCMYLDGYNRFYGASLPCHLKRRFVCQRRD